MEIVFPKIDLARIKAVMMDLDHTLYDFVEAEKYALAVCHQKYSKEFDTIDLSEFISLYNAARMEILLRLSPQGACRSRFLAFQYWFESHNIRQAYTLALRYEALYWDQLIDHIRLAKQAEEFIERVKHNHLPIAIVTNMQPQIQVRKLQKLKLTDRIDFLVTSEESHAEKPSPYPFRLALEKLAVKAGEVIMVGDNHKRDIIGAENLGIVSYLVTHT